MGIILVAGGGGYIGRILLEVLLGQGHEVRCLDRFFFGRDILSDLEGNARLDVRRDDIRTVHESVFEGVDVVMDLAGIANDPSCDLDPDVTRDINVRGAVRFAELAKKSGVGRYIYSSSCSIYGRGKAAQLTEESPLTPVSLYAETKIKVEEELRRMSCPSFAVTCLRNATVYGLSRKMRFDLVINMMTLFAYRERRIFILGGGEQWRPLVHVRDVARAFTKAMDAPLDQVEGQAFNVGSNEQNFQVRRIAHMIQDVVPNASIEMVPSDPDKRTYNVSFDKIAGTLGFTAERSPYEGIVEVKQALERGQIDDSIRTRTLEFYKYLVEAEGVIREVSLNGRVF